MSIDRKFEVERKKTTAKQGADCLLKSLGERFIVESIKTKYSFHFDWLGRPIIQYQQDIVAMQEIVWRVKPDLIIESGIARGGSLIFHASLLELIGGRRKVVGIDIDIREHNREEIEKHKLSKRIILLEGSSVDEKIVTKVKKISKKHKKILVILDSNHSHEHVLRELENYAPLVNVGSYCVVFDTIIEAIPEKFYDPRPWN